MKHKITPLMIFGILWMLVIAISWNAFPGWKNIEGGLWLLIGAAAVGVIAFLKDGISFIKKWVETLTLHENQPVFDQMDELDSRITGIPWEARDPKFVKKYFDLCGEYDEKFNEYYKEKKQVEFFLSYGLIKNSGNRLFFTQAGALLFCNPALFPHSMLHTEVVLRDETDYQNVEQRKVFSGPILATYYQIYELLKPLATSWKAPNMRNEHGQELEFFFYPEVVITEALVNFFIHRNYLKDDRGFITIYYDRIEFYNPGSSDYSAEQLMNVNEPLLPSYRRNPRLLQALQNTGLNQSEGRGILRIKDALNKNRSTNPQGKVGIFIENDDVLDRFRLVVYKRIPRNPKLKKERGGRARLLIIEDDLDIGKTLSIYFSGMELDVELVVRGSEALEICKTFMPNVIILDIMLPDIDGYEVCRTLRKNIRTNHIPVIFLTQKDERINKLEGLEHGGDDYITKPFDIEELKLRVQGAIRRSERESLTDPRSGLPAGRLIEEQLRRIIRETGWAVLDVRIYNFDPFKEVYGFVASDEVLRFTAMLIGEVVEEMGTVSDFIGHAGGDNFIIVTSEACADVIGQRLKNRFDKEVLSQYDVIESEQGFIKMVTSEGKVEKIPLMTISIGSISPRLRSFSDIREITESAAEARHRARAAEDRVQRSRISG